MGYRSESNISSVILGEPSRDCLTAVGIGVGSGGGGGCVLLEKSSVPLLSLNSSVEVTANGSRIVSAGLLNPYHVSEEVVSQWAGILSITLLLLSCLIGNGLLVSFVCRKGSGIQTRKGMRVRNLEQLVGLIAVVSIVNGSMLCLFQIASMIQSSGELLFLRVTYRGLLPWR